MFFCAAVVCCTLGRELAMNGTLLDLHASLLVSSEADNCKLMSVGRSLRNMARCELQINEMVGNRAGGDLMSSSHAGITLGPWIALLQ